ncbi:hypothetical protein K432DRAFT_420180 [Lepidopterella palustris CBS 459.81]|uniref:6-phosphogluconate dehydrogenase NADP-binding domain-containing protein n=1 Tax=Lepidopterella palustris CBS 459.81 TaxID=1314670 RepID=A0A8E2J9X6_9PEZI|nr:hypothetical protein K432DRAFT_420180 [Lepidopterella palustris CBS 459.81]
MFVTFNGWIEILLSRARCRALTRQGSQNGTFTPPAAKLLHLLCISGKTKVASSIENVVKSVDIVFVCLSNDKAVNDTVDTALRADVKRKLFMDCSTAYPQTSNVLSKTISGKRAEFVAMLVFDAPAMAHAGSLHRESGQATLLKGIGNTFVIYMVESLLEDHKLAKKSGLGSKNLRKLIKSMFFRLYTTYLNRIMAGDFNLAKKNERHALDLAKKTRGNEDGCVAGGCIVPGRGGESGLKLEN